MDIYIEQQVIKGILENKDFREAILVKAKPEHFDNDRLALIFRELKKSFERYGRLTDIDSIAAKSENPAEVKAAYEEILRLTFNPISQQAELVENATKWLREQTLKKGLMEVVLKIENQQPANELLEDLAGAHSLLISGGDFEQFTTADNFTHIDLGEISYHLYPIVSEASVILLNAARGTGKTLFAMYAADAISKGQDFCCWQNKSGPQKVLYFDGEVFYKEFQERLKQLDPSENLYTYCRTYSDAQRKKPLLLTDEDSRTEIRKFIVDRGIKFVVFDNLASLSVGIDENQKRDYDPINQFFLSLRGLGVSVMILHHTGKSGAQRGTSGREDNVDTIIQLVDRKEGAAEAKFELYFEKFRGMVTSETKALVRKRELKCTQDEAGKWVWHFEEARLDRDPDFVAGLLGGKSIRELAERHAVSKYKVDTTVKWMLDRNIIQRTGSTTRGTSYEISDNGRDWYGEEWAIIEAKILGI